MDGISMSGLHGRLHRLSSKNFATLKRYFAGDTLSSKEQISLQKEITELRDTSKDLLSLD